MENEIEFDWPGTGTLKIVSRGLDSVALRYLPALEVIAAELAKHRTTASKEAQEGRVQTTHPES